MILSGLGLWAVIKNARETKQTDPRALPADTGRHVRIRDEAGVPVPGAVALILQRRGAAPLDVAWHPGVGVLVLPEGGKDYPVRVYAPERRVHDLPAVRGGQSITLKPGLIAKVALRGVPPDGLPEHVRFLLRVRPVEIEALGLEPQEIVNLMGHRGGAGSGPEHIPRGDFGYPLSREQAQAGIVVPSPGRYHVHWGLIDTQARTWFRMGAGSGREFEVGDVAKDQAFFIDVTIDGLQETLDGLAEKVAEVRAKR